MSRASEGSVGAVYAAYDLPDDTPGDEDAPVQQLYSVRFEGPELWGELGGARHGPAH